MNTVKSVKIYKQFISLILSLAMATPATWAATPPAPGPLDADAIPTAENHKRYYKLGKDADGNSIVHIYDLIHIDDSEDLEYAKSQTQKLLKDRPKVDFAFRLVPDTVQDLTISVIPEAYPQAVVETLELPLRQIALQLNMRSLMKKSTDPFKKAWSGLKNWYGKTLDKAGESPDKFDTKMAIWRGVGVASVFAAGLIQIDGLSWMESLAAASAATLVGFSAGSVTAGGISFAIQKKMKDYTNWIPRPAFIAKILSKAVSTNMYFNGVPGGIDLHANTIKDNFLDRSFWSLQLTNESTKFYITEFIVLTIVAASIHGSAAAGFGVPLFETFEDFLWVTSEYSFRVLVSQGILDIAFSKHKALDKIKSMKLSVENGLWPISFLILSEQEQIELIDDIIDNKVEAPKELIKRLRRVETDFAFRIFLVALGTNFGAAAGLTGNDLGKMVLNAFTVGGAGYLAYVSAHNGPAMKKLHETYKDIRQGSLKKACNDLFKAVGRIYK